VIGQEMKFIPRLKQTLKSISLVFSLGLGLGLIIGIVLSTISDSKDLTLLAIVAGAILSVVIEKIFDFGRSFTQEYKNTLPLKKILGNIASDKSVIYVSPFYRDTNNPDQSKLYRYERDRISLPLIAGTQYVYGKSDALAMSLVLATIQKVTRTSHFLIEDDWQALEKWGRASICIGAHNAKTREILEKFDSTFFRFAANYSSIVKDSEFGKFTDDHGVTSIPAVFQKKISDSSIIDYGIILKLRDQFHSNKEPIIVIAGIGDWGTAGAAYFLLSHYLKLPFDKDEFGVLIQVPSGYESARIVEFDKVSDYILEGLTNNDVK
jgi:hypothetical protein